MPTDPQDRHETARVMKMHDAFCRGDLQALRAAAENPDDVPNGQMPLAIGSCLEYAIYHSPMAFIRSLLELGANPNPADHSGFPPLIAALSCSRSQPGSPARPDVPEIITMLLEFGADPNGRGVNDYTPVHMAVAEGHVRAVKILLDGGADPLLRTRIDYFETPLETAERAGNKEIVALFTEFEQQRRTRERATPDDSADL